MSEGESLIRGEVLKINFRDETEGYTVVRLRAPGGGEFVAVGQMPPLNVGQQVELTGRWGLHPRYGMQFNVTSCRVKAPGDPEGVVRYLASGLVKGLGPKLAKRIVEQLGPDALHTIASQPELLKQVPGIGPRRAEAIAKALATHTQRHHTITRLLAMGLPMGVATKLWEAYGASAPEAIAVRPYEIAREVEGIGFATAERLARAVGIGPDDPARAMAGLEHCLSKAMEEEGHLYLPRDELLERTARLLNIRPQALESALEELENRQRVVSVALNGGVGVYLPMAWQWESDAAEGLVRIASGRGVLPSARALKALKWVAGELGITLTPTQEAAVHLALTKALVLITGGPGTGKTTLVRCLVHILRRMGLPITLSAPTGRAARRLAEASQYEASTIHRMLGYSPGLRRFAKAVDAAMVVVDEASMIDSWLMSALLKAIAQGARLLLVGDENQLPPVGPGAPFTQILSWAPRHVARLTHLVRHARAGELARVAHEILGGRLPRLPRELRPGRQVVFVPEPDPHRAASVVVELVTRRIPAMYGFDPTNEIQVLVPMHRGVLGSRNLNLLLRSTLNPGSDTGLRAGDKVVQTRNNYELGVFNGEMGVVREVREGAVVVAMDRGEILYSPHYAHQLELAYAMSVHKAQGSEYPAVVIVLGTEHYPILTRPLLYTALTRAKRLAVVVGHPRALRRAVANARVTKRYSLLAELARKNQGAGTGLPT